MKLGSPEYKQLARRFAILLHRKYTVGLTPAEEAEYQRVSAQMAMAEMAHDLTKTYGAIGQ